MQSHLVSLVLEIRQLETKSRKSCSKPNVLPLLSILFPVLSCWSPFPLDFTVENRKPSRNSRRLSTPSRILLVFFIDVISVICTYYPSLISSVVLGTKPFYFEDYPLVNYIASDRADRDQFPIATNPSWLNKAASS